MSALFTAKIATYNVGRYLYDCMIINGIIIITCVHVFVCDSYVCTCVCAHMCVSMCICVFVVVCCLPASKSIMHMHVTSLHLRSKECISIH